MSFMTLWRTMAVVGLVECEKLHLASVVLIRTATDILFIHICTILSPIFLSFHKLHHLLNSISIST